MFSVSLVSLFLGTKPEAIWCWCHDPGFFVVEKFVKVYTKIRHQVWGTANDVDWRVSLV